MKSRWSFSPNFYQLPKSSSNNDIIEHMYPPCHDNTTPSPVIYHPIISDNREGSGSESSPPSHYSDLGIAPSAGSGGRVDHVGFRCENGDTEPGEPFVLGFSSGDGSQFLPLQSSGSFNRSYSNNNTKKDRLEDELNLRGECAHSSAVAPTSLGASVDEWATCFSPRIKESADRSASLITASSPDPLDDLHMSFIPPGATYTKQLDFPHLVVLAKTQGASNGEKGVSSMVGCTIGDIVPVDVSGQSRDIDLPVGQVGWTLSLREEAEDDNAKPNSFGTKIMMAPPSSSRNNSTTLVGTAITITPPLTLLK